MLTSTIAITGTHAQAQPFNMDEGKSKRHLTIDAVETTLNN